MQEVVLTSLDTLRAQETRDFVALRMFVEPFSYRGVHVTLDVNPFVAESGMVENLKNVIDNFIYRYVWVFPREHDPAANV